MVPSTYEHSEPGCAPAVSSPDVPWVTMPRNSEPAPGAYSSTPLSKKLGVKEGHTLLLIGAPARWEVPRLPAKVQLIRRSNAPRTRDSKAEVVISFFETAAALFRDGPPIARSLAPTSALWVAWPRRAGGHESDITEQLMRDILLPIGIVDVKVAALDRDWSGLKFVWRREDREDRGRLPDRS